MASFTIPTQFTGRDKSYSSTVDKMASKTASLGNKLDGALNRGQSALSKFTPHLDHITKSVLESFGVMAVARKIEQGIEFSVEAVEKFDEVMQNTKATTGLSGEAWDQYKEKVIETAKDTKKSAIHVAEAFQIIAKERPELQGNAEALGEVSKAVIELADAGKMQFEPTAKALSGIMNKFGLNAHDAEHAIDALAAGTRAGSSGIEDTTAALDKFGNTAKQTGMTLNESIALTQMVSGFSKGEEAGTKLQKILNVMQTPALLSPKALEGMNKYHVNMKLMSDKTVPFSTRLKEFTKIGGSTTIMTEIFGKKATELGYGLMKTAGNFDALLAKTEEHGVASKMAAENENTLEAAVDRLKSSWVNMLVGTNAANGGLQKIKDTIDWVAEHMEDIVKWGGRVLMFFAAWKAALIIGRAVMIGYNIVMGINNALTLSNIELVEGNTVAKAASVITEKAMAASIWFSNTAIGAMNISLGATVAILGGVVLAIGAAIMAYNSYEEAKDIHNGKGVYDQKTAYKNEEKTIDGLIERYEKMGMTKEQASKKAIEYERKTIAEDQSALIEKSAGEKDDEKKHQLEMQIQEKTYEDQYLNHRIVSGANEKQAIATDMHDMLGEGTDNPHLISTKAASQEAINSSVNNTTTEKGELTIHVKGDGEVTDVDEGGLKNSKIKIGSTQPMH